MVYLLNLLYLLYIVYSINILHIVYLFYLLYLENREWVHVQNRYILLTCHTSIGGLVALHEGGDGIGTSCGSQDVQGSNPLAATLGLALLYG